jgi:hypothetical protein
VHRLRISSLAHTYQFISGLELPVAGFAELAQHPLRAKLRSIEHSANHGFGLCLGDQAQGLLSWAWQVVVAISVQQKRKSAHSLNVFMVGAL